MTVMSTPRSRFRFAFAEERMPTLSPAPSRLLSRRMGPPMDIVIAGDHTQRFEGWTEQLRGSGLQLVPTASRLDAVLSSVGSRRPAALVVDLSELTRSGLELAQQIALRDEFLALPILFLLPESARSAGVGTAPGYREPAPRDPWARPAPALRAPLGGFAPARDVQAVAGDGYSRDAANFALSPEVRSSLESILLQCADFMFAPVTAYELAVRLSRLVREPEKDRTEQRYSAGPVDIDDRAHRVVAEGREVGLRKKEYDLLLFLVRNAGSVFTRDALLRWVWGPGFTGDARTVDVHIRRLRSKLGIRAGAIIETVRRVGYRLTPDAVPGSDSVDE